MALSKNTSSHESVSVLKNDTVEKKSDICTDSADVLTNNTLENEGDSCTGSADVLTNKTLENKGDICTESADVLTNKTLENKGDSFTESADVLANDTSEHKSDSSNKINDVLNNEKSDVKTKESLSNQVIMRQIVSSNLNKTKNNTRKRNADEIDGSSTPTSEDFTDCFIFKKSKKSFRETYLPVTVWDSVSYEDQNLDYVYKMDTPTRGKVVLINIEHFSSSTGMSKRKGTNNDAEAVIKLFRDLSFEVDYYKDVKTHEVKQALTEAASQSREFSCFICVILSHGENGVVYAYDGALEIRELALIFEQSSWIGKPKIFLIQACQGYEYMDGVKSPDCLDGNHQNNVCISLPSKADFLFAYSTVPGFYSWRNTAEGSWFIQCLVEEFRNYAHKLDVLRMLTRVNAKLALRRSYTDEHETNNKRQSAYIVSLLRKEVYFFPPNGQLTQNQRSNRMIIG